MRAWKAFAICYLSFGLKGRLGYLQLLLLEKLVDVLFVDYFHRKED